MIQLLRILCCFGSSTCLRLTRLGGKFIAIFDVTVKFYYAQQTSCHYFAMHRKIIIIISTHKYDHHHVCCWYLLSMKKRRQNTYDIQNNLQTYYLLLLCFMQIYVYFYHCNIKTARMILLENVCLTSFMLLCTLEYPALALLLQCCICKVKRGHSYTPILWQFSSVWRDEPLVIIVAGSHTESWMSKRVYGAMTGWSNSNVNG